jgi:DNA polymerase-3 subunit epsilon
MENIPSFVALDFETACYDKLSACSVGVALFEHGTLTESRSWLLKPANPGKFSFTRVHGLTWDDVKNQGTIKDIWYELEGYLHNNFVIAHNAIFDMTVLKENLQHYNIEYKNYYYNCTLNISKRFLPFLTDYKLETLCRLHNIEYGNHDAENDAISCGRLFSTILQSHKYPQELFTGSQLENKSYLSKHAFMQPKPANLDGMESDDVDGSATLEFFKDKSYVITGFFQTINKEVIEDKINDYGGKKQSSVNGKTEMIVIGTEPGWAKVDKIRALKQQGKTVLVLDESELLQVFAKLDYLQEELA